MTIFHKFLAGKKSAKMPKKSAKVLEKRNLFTTSGRVGGRGGRCREPFGGGLTTADISGSVWHALPPRGRRIRMRLAARAPPPPILELGVRCSWLHSAAWKFSIEILGHLVLFGAFWCYLELSGPVCGYLVLSGAI